MSSICKKKKRKKTFNPLSYTHTCVCAIPLGAQCSPRSFNRVHPFSRRSHTLLRGNVWSWRSGDGNDLDVSASLQKPAMKMMMMGAIPAHQLCEAFVEVMCSTQGKGRGWVEGTCCTIHAAICFPSQSLAPQACELLETEGGSQWLCSEPLRKHAS